jgi:hypothetical protein
VDPGGRRLLRRREPRDGCVHAVAPQHGGPPRGHEPTEREPRSGFGDFFAYRDLLERWLAEGDLAGLELR